MKALYFCFLLLSNSVLLAQKPGMPDESFGNNGVVKHPGTPLFTHVAALSDGKLIVGNDGKYKGYYTFVIQRLLPDGTLDTTYGTGGTASVLFPNFTAPSIDSVVADLENVIALPDGKVIAMGVTHYNSTIEYDIALARFNANGTVDSTFGTNGTALYDTYYGVPSLHTLNVQSNGNIIIGGEITTDVNNYVIHPYLIGFTANGVINKRFGNGGEVVSKDLGEFHCVAIDKDDKIIAGGEKYKGFVYDTYELVKYNANGTIDTAFVANAYNTHRIFVFGITSIALQNDGKILVTYNDQSLHREQTFSVARFTKQGLLDSSFGNNGIVNRIIGDRAYAVQVLLTGVNRNRIVVIGGTYTADNRVVNIALSAFYLNGLPDKSFGADGIQTTAVTNLNYALSGLPMSDGKIVVLGYYTKGGIFSSDDVACLFRYNGYEAQPLVAYSTGWCPRQPEH